MSIRQAIQQALCANLLYLLEPEFMSDSVVRHMLLHPELHKDLERAYEIPRLGRLKADLEAFVLGHEITMCMTPREHKSAYMGLLEPISKGTWDIRSRDPCPGIRVFGAFADVDTFVALHWMPRSRPIAGFDKKPLKDDEMDWQFAMMEAEARWKIALPEVTPKIGGDVSGYISEKVRPISD
jgi:hypothetical protein